MITTLNILNKELWIEKNGDLFFQSIYDLAQIEIENILRNSEPPVIPYKVLGEEVKTIELRSKFENYLGNVAEY